jgi:hypothetical protein
MIERILLLLTTRHTVIAYFDAYLDLRACRYFDELSSRWDTSGCQLVEEMSTPNLTVCCCTHLTLFGINIGDPSDIVVPINKIDFIKDAENLAKIASDPLAAVTIGVLYLMYFISLAVLRRLDIRDSLIARHKKKKVLSTVYVLYVKTKDKALRKPVNINIEGGQGRMSLLVKPSLFSRSRYSRDEDMFIFSSIDLGKLAFLTIEKPKDVSIESVRILNTL